MTIAALAGCALFTFGFLLNSGGVLLIGTILVEVAGPYAIVKLFFSD